jgi:flagellin-like hook-associated protein FlgL
MVVNTNLPAETALTGLQRNPSAPGKSPARPGTVSSPAGPADAVPASGNIVETAPAATAAGPEIVEPDTALQSTEFARTGMLAQSRTTLLAQANLSPATVFKLLQ